MEKMLYEPAKGVFHEVSRAENADAKVKTALHRTRLLAV